MTAKKGYTYPSLKVTRKRFVDIKDSSYSFAFFYVQHYRNGVKFPAAKDLHKCGTLRGINYILCLFSSVFPPKSPRVADFSSGIHGSEIQELKITCVTCCLNLTDLLTCHIESSSDKSGHLKITKSPHFAKQGCHFCELSI